MGDAEWMYENDLDPLYRKDRETGEIVEWEGGLNPAYEDEGESYSLHDENDSKEPIDINMFHTFEDAKAWAKENPGRSFTKSPDGNGYIVKDSKPNSTTYIVKEKNHKQYENIRPLVFNKIKNYLTRIKAEADNFEISSMSVTYDLYLIIGQYMQDENLMTDWYDDGGYGKNGYKTLGDKDYQTYKNRPIFLRFVNFHYTPNFSIKDYEGILYIVSSEGSVASHGSSKKGHDGKRVWMGSKDKARRCKTILDLYFDILSERPNDLIDISFDVSLKS